MANPSKPPPGNTTTATPVFFPFGEYIVIVGRQTLLTQTQGLPATRWSFTVVTYSGPGTGCASGTAPGHIGCCLCPGDGCQTGACALRPPNENITQRANIKSFITIPTA